MTDVQTMPAGFDPQLQVAARALIDRGRLTSADADELIRCVRRHQALQSWRGLGQPWEFRRERSAEHAP